MVATAIYSVTMVLWKETAFPLCRTIEKHWNRNVVSRVSSVIVVIRLCELSGHLMPCTSCLYGKWVEDVCAGQFGVFVYLVLCCLVGCCTWCSCCVANVRLSKCVWYCHVPGHWLSSGPWQKSGPIWAFVVISHQVDWLFNCWHLSSLDRSPQDVIQMTVTLLSGSTSAAR